MSFDPNAAARPDSGIFGLFDTPEEAGVVLLPVPWDATTSYRAGASKGPAAILEASRQVDLFDVETGKPYLAKIALLPESESVRAWNAEARALAEPIIRAGGAGADGTDGDSGLERVNELSAAVNRFVHTEAKGWLAKGKIVGLVGGDHATPFGSIRAHAEKYPGMGVLHIDAHADLRHAYEGFRYSHASIMECALREIDGLGTIVQAGIRDLCEEEYDRIQGSGGKVRTFYDAGIAGARMRGALESHFAEIVSVLPRDVYVSFDIDGLDPVLCPNTGTPVPGGLSFHEASALIGAVVKAKKRIVGFDLNEVAPGEDEWDGNVGARMLYKLIGWTLLSRATAAL